MCVALCACSASALTPTGSSAARSHRARAATATTLHVFVPAHQPTPKGQTLSLLVHDDRRADATISLAPGDNTAPLDLVPGTHELRVTVAAPGTKTSVSHVFVDIAGCAANKIDLALYASAASIAIASLDPNVERRSGGYFAPFGGGTFDVTALDAKGDTIVGPNAPAIAVKSSNSKVAASFSAPNTLGVSIDGYAPFDSMLHARITLSSATAKRRFAFSVERTTWPTVPPSPTPAPCS